MPEKEDNIVRVSLDPHNPPSMTEEQRTRMAALAKMPDSEIDYSDIPPVTDFSGWRRVTPRSSFVRVDGDILDWIKTLGRDREALVNDILRREMNIATGNPA